MKLYRNTMIGRRYKAWSRREAIAYFIKGIARELKIAPDFFLKWYEAIVINRFKKKWLVSKNNVSFFDFNGAKLPNVSDNPDNLKALVFPIFLDTFLFHCYYNDDYSRDNVLRLDPYMLDGVYGYTDSDFDVTVNNGDIVIDAGAWIGDFSAYVASKGAKVYAFEPVRKNFELLCQTKDLNNIDGDGQIYPVRKGLGYNECEIDISVDTGGCEGSSFIIDRKTSIREKISVTTLDRFVEENGVGKVDFIKADIEGAERDMLRGATHVLKTFAPKLAICTYHLPDDPEVLEKIIREANPKYKVVHLRHKLFAAVI